MRAIVKVVLCLAFGLSAGAAISGELRETRTGAGAPVKVIADFPPGPGPFPAVVVANGKGGDMLNAVPAELAVALTARGLAVVRFDWRYRTADPQNGKPSESLGEEVEDVLAAIRWARNDRRIVDSNIVLAGKSVGSVVTSRVFAHDPALRGLVLLTPLCGQTTAKPGSPAWVATPYPDLPAETRPVAIIAGNSDDLCPTASLYALAATFRAPVRIAIVGGDHGFAEKDDPAKSRDYLDLAVRNAAAAASAYLGR